MRVRLEYARDVITRAVLREQIRHVIADVQRACDSASVTAVDASVQRPPDREQSASNDSRTRVMRSCWVLTPQGYLDQHRREETKRALADLVAGALTKEEP